MWHNTCAGELGGSSSKPSLLGEIGRSAVKSPRSGLGNFVLMGLRTCGDGDEGDLDCTIGGDPNRSAGEPSGELYGELVAAGPANDGGAAANGSILRFEKTGSAAGSAAACCSRIACSRAR